MRNDMIKNAVPGRKCQAYSGETAAVSIAASDEYLKIAADKSQVSTKASPIHMLNPKYTPRAVATPFPPLSLKKGEHDR